MRKSKTPESLVLAQLSWWLPPPTTDSASSSDQLPTRQWSSAACLFACLPLHAKKKALGWFFVSSGKNVDFLLLLLWNKRDLYTSTKIKGSCCTKWRHGCWRGVTATSLQGYLSVVCGRALTGVWGPRDGSRRRPPRRNDDLVYSLVSTTSSISGL